MPPITPNLWFDTDAEEAAKFYVSIFNDRPAPGATNRGHDQPSGRSRIVDVTPYPDDAPRPSGSHIPPDTAMTVEFELDGQRFVGINGGPQFTFDEAVSFAIACETQDEVDYFWERLTEGGKESQCGWLKDRYGLSWQVIPSALGDVLNDPDPERAHRAMQAMLQMTKLDVAELRRAADGTVAGQAH